MRRWRDVRLVEMSSGGSPARLRRRRPAPATAQDLGEGPLEFATRAGVDERVEAAVAVAQPEAAGKQRRRDVAR